MEYEWHINSFSSLRHKCLSDAFEALAYKWKVIMYPLGNGDAALDQLSLFLGVSDAKKLPPGWSKLARFRLQIVNHINPAKTISKEVTHKFNTTNSDYGWRSFVDLSTLHDPQAGFIKNDLVTIKASVTEVDRRAEAAAQAKAVIKQKTPNSREDHAKAKTYPKCLRRDDGHDNPHDAMIEILYHIASFRKIVLSRPYGANNVITTLQRIFYQMHQGSQPISTELLMYRANLVTTKSNLYETDWLLSSLLSNLSPPLEHSGKALFLEPAHIVCEMTPNNVLEGLKRHFSHKPILVDNSSLPSIIRAYITAKSIPQDKKSVFPLNLPLAKFAPVKDHEHTLYYLFAIEVGEGNDHFYSYIKPFGNQNWFKIDGDPVEIKTQLNNTHSTITIYGEVHDRPPNYLLFYVKDTEVSNVLADVQVSQYSTSLKKGMRDLVEEYDPYILLKVYVDEDFTSFFGLVNEDVLVKEFEVKCTKTLKEFKSVIQTEFGIPVDHQLFWIMEAEDDGQKRPQRAIPPVDEEFPLGDLAETSVVLELYLQDLKAISPAVACKEMLLFLKFYDPATLTLRYYGSAVFKGKMKVGQVADSIHQIMGNTSGTKLWLYEEVSPECVTLLHPDSTLNEAELCTGGIIIFQRSISSEARRGLAYPTAPDFCDWILNRVHISLRPLDDIYSTAITFEVHKNTPYDNLAAQVSRKLDIPAHKLVFFVFKYESSVTQISIPLSRELYPSVMADLGTYRYAIYYLEQKPAPAELHNHTLAMRVWWYDYFNTPVKEHCFELEADASVANVLQYIQSSVKLDPERGTGRVRLMVLSNSHIMHVFEEDEKLSNFAYPPLSYLRAEEESKEEINIEKGITKLVEVMQIFYSEGMVMAGNDPFLLCIRTEELFGKVKERVQKRLKIKDEDFKRSRVIMHNNAGKPVHITDGHAFSEEELGEYKYLAIYSAKPKHTKFNNNNNGTQNNINKPGFSVGNTNIIANISEAVEGKNKRQRIAKNKQNGITHTEHTITLNNTPDTKTKTTDTKHEKDITETVNTTESNTTNTTTATEITNTKNTTNKEESEENNGIPDEVEDVIGKRLTRNVVNEFFWKKKNEEVLQKVKEEEERTRTQQKEQMQKRMAEVEKFAKLREERLQKQLEDTVKKEDRRRLEEEIEIDDIEHEIEEIRRRDKQMEEERKGIEREIMTDEELIRRELENRKKEIEIMTNFINMKNNASKWIADAKSSLQSDSAEPKALPAPQEQKSNKKKNYGIEKIERYFKEIKYENIKLGVPKTVLGHGGSSKVVKATYLGQEVAIKKFHGNFDSILPKVRMEIALLSELRHPHIILLIGACTEPSKPLCVVTEYMPNGSLFDVIHVRCVTLPLYMKLSIAKDIARGLNFLHKSNPICIHRDLNSKNILLDEYFRAKVADFGISRLVSPNTPAMTCHLGSSEWSAPELLMGDDYAHKVDSYSFAVILWELFTGQVPYGTLGLSPLQIGLQVITKGLRPSPLPSLSTCPPLILELILKCWDKDPIKRWEFDAILECLNAVIIDPSPVVSLSNTPHDKVKPSKVDECKICFNKKINTCLVPCGHLCVCSECSEVITRDPKGGSCPICRSKIQKVVVTYQS